MCPNDRFGIKTVITSQPQNYQLSIVNYQLGMKCLQTPYYITRAYARARTRKKYETIFLKSPAFLRFFCSNIIFLRQFGIRERPERADTKCS